MSLVDLKERRLAEFESFLAGGWSRLELVRVAYSPAGLEATLLAFGELVRARRIAPPDLPDPGAAGDTWEFELAAEGGSEPGHRRLVLGSFLSYLLEEEARRLSHGGAP